MLEGLASVDEKLRRLYGLCRDVLQHISLPDIDKSRMEDQVWALDTFTTKVIKYVSHHFKNGADSCAHAAHVLRELCEKVMEYVSSALETTAEEMVSK